ncbi:MAG: transcription antitermination factor NusB [Bdellovibrionota bacterium]
MTTPSSGGLRRRSREMALQLLFQTEFAMNTAFEAGQVQDMLRRFREDFDIGNEVSDFGGELFLGVAERITEIDAIIQAHSAHWKTSRMGLVDLSVMRVSIFEMKFLAPPTPPSVAINEAVEIAKTYGSTESGAFVNGILDHVARGL